MVERQARQRPGPELGLRQCGRRRQAVQAECGLQQQRHGPGAGWGRRWRRKSEGHASQKMEVEAFKTPNAAAVSHSAEPLCRGDFAPATSQRRWPIADSAGISDPASKPNDTTRGQVGQPQRGQRIGIGIGTAVDRQLIKKQAVVGAPGDDQQQAHQVQDAQRGASCQAKRCRAASGRLGRGPPACWRRLGAWVGRSGINAERVGLGAAAQRDGCDCG